MLSLVEAFLGFFSRIHKYVLKPFEWEELKAKIEKVHSIAP